MSEVNLYSGSAGLNTVVDAARIPFDSEQGFNDLAAAVNVSIDQSGRINRRLGYRRWQDGTLHSLFCDGGDCFVVADRASDAAIYQVEPGLENRRGIRDGLAIRARMAYAQVGDETYYSNGFNNGVIRGGVSSPWPTDESINETTRSFSTAPIGHHLAWAFGRMFVARDNILYWSEPYMYGLLDQARSLLQFHKKVLMIKPVAGGLFLSDERSTWFLAGTNPAEFTQTKVATYPAIEWSEAIGYVEGLEIGLDPGLCALWASVEGACLGTPTGMLVSLNKEKVNYRPALEGAGLLRGFNYIHCMA